MPHQRGAPDAGHGALDVAPLESARGLEMKMSVLDDLIDVNVFTPASVRFSPEVVSFDLHDVWVKVEK